VLLRVTSYGGGAAHYALTTVAISPQRCVDDDSEPNDSPAQAAPLQRWLGGRVLCPGDVDHYRFEVPRPGAESRVVVTSAAGPLGGTLSVEGSSVSIGTVVADATVGATTVTFDSLAATSYLLAVEAPAEVAAVTYAIAVYGARPPNDSCAAATPLVDGAVVPGSTLDATDDLRFNAGFASCTGWAMLGGDVAYRVDLPAGAMLDARLEAQVDLGLYLLDDCVSGCCWRGVDLQPGGQPEQLRFANGSGAELHLNLIVDSFDPTVAGDFELSVAIGADLDAGGDDASVPACQPDLPGGEEDAAGSGG